MFFVLSKITSFLLQPLSWIILCMVGSLIIKNKRRRKKLRWLALTLLIFFTNPGISNWAMKTWEVAPVGISTLPDSLAFAVVLSGVTNPLQEPTDRTHFNKGADRLLHAIQLYHEGKIKNLLITGGSGYVLHQNVSESQGLANVALMAGVKPEHLHVEEQSRNTRENALYSSEIINQKWPGERFLLVTSAFHMRRSLGCFEKVGLQPMPFSSDLYSAPWDRKNPLPFVVPSSDSLGIWNILIREWVGIISYRVAGYI